MTMDIRSRTQVRQEKKIYVKRFYDDWKEFAYEYANHPDCNRIRCYNDNYDSVVITWQSPGLMKYKGQLSKNNQLQLSLIHPDDSDGQITFTVKITMNFEDKGLTQQSIQHDCIINPALNLYTSVILTKILISLSNVVKQNKLESHVSRTVIAIMDSIQAGTLIVPTSLYTWSPTNQGSNNMTNLTAREQHLDNEQKIAEFDEERLALIDPESYAALTKEKEERESSTDVSFDDIPF